MMSNKQLLLKDKHLDVISICQAPKTRLMIEEGTIRSSKTVVAIQSFFYRVMQSQHYLQLIAGRDTDAIKDTLLDSEFGLLKQFPSFCTLKKDKLGGYYVNVRTPTGFKKVMLVGYGNRSKWQKILGKTIDTVFVDEVNIADKQFIDETFSRQASCDNPLTIWTLNGDVPTHWIYEDYINRAAILGQCPASIRADMAKRQKEDNWFYTHWNMSDNPVMTADKIAKAAAVYPVGSYYHTIKILGERGTPGRLIYNDYMSYDKLVKPIEFAHYPKYGVGIDVGATRAKNSITLVGFKNDYSSAAVVDKYTFQQSGYLEKAQKIKATVMNWIAKGAAIEYVAVDSAEQNFITDLKAEFERCGLPQVIASYKATIKQRIDLVIILMAYGGLVFNKTAEGENAYKAYQIARWTEGKDGEEREDNNEWQNDVMDSVEYALTRHMSKLMCAQKVIKNEDN